MAANLKFDISSTLIEFVIEMRVICLAKIMQYK
jgi:hypothetical protein